MIRDLRTPQGVTFSLLGERPDTPAPTLFVLGADATHNLSDPNSIESGRALREQQGFLCVSLDSPCEGGDQRPDEPWGLAGWRTRVEAGEDIVADFNTRAGSVLDCLVDEGYTDPGRVVFLGISRGGFLALHVAAADPRVRAVAAIAPVTELRKLEEFTGLDDHPLTESLALLHRAAALVDRPVWLIIGDRDHRVGTDHTIALARAISRCSEQNGAPGRVTLHVVPADGHTQPEQCHTLVAEWVRSVGVPRC